ncbi:bifunctional Delta(1)-pyrroline-2-carboxylate/Delta(1)-piperideine-2-carboxylate reductase [Amphibiibacter pelophylacis]|uniref:Delta(1)-pyrroline-2-carboxylate reductase family protein n=1 Tax=Amphibiibacter pelophylacis TaxID=1799477 RepID=A0ACC6P139_9BURK
MPDTSHFPAPPSPLTVYSAAQTAALLDFRALMDALATASVQAASGEIDSPVRQVVPLVNGGVMLSMPATADDIAIHKLVNVQPGNARAGLPTINGLVTAFEARTGQPLFVLDGPEVTGRRTAAVSMLALRHLLPQGPRHVLLIGAGAQARFHVLALHALDSSVRISVRSRSSAALADFCSQHAAQGVQISPDAADTVADDVDAVICCTTSSAPVYDEPARPGRVVIGVGAFKPDMAEIGAQTLSGSTIYTDEPEGAQHEAGDLLRAGVDWAQVLPLSTLVQQPPDLSAAAVFKSVGYAAWDLAAARVARAALA